MNFEKANESSIFFFYLVYVLDIWLIFLVIDIAGFPSQQREALIFYFY